LATASKTNITLKSAITTYQQEQALCLKRVVHIVNKDKVRKNVPLNPVTIEVKARNILRTWK